MITISNIGAYGRLGNQLFQYAILKAISIKTGYEIVLPENVFENEWHGQKCLLHNFKLPSCVFKPLTIQHNYYEKNARHYDELIYQIPDNCNLFGFFQNPRYYNNIVNDLRIEFQLNDTIQSKIDTILHNYKNTIVSLHIRRGDLSDGTNQVDNYWANDFSENSILKKYYDSALKLIPEDSTVLLFTGGSRENLIEDDIIWCKNHFKDNRIVFIENLNDIEAFGLIKSCHVNITSFASTFSWWASFLNQNNNVIAPKDYYPSHNIAITDVYPNNWILI